MVKFEILRNNLEVVVLSKLKESPMHGYKLLKLTRCAPSTIYPLLMLMEKEGYVASQWHNPEVQQKVYLKQHKGRAALEMQRPRKEYTITAEGLRHLQGLQAEYQIFVADFLKVEA